MNGKQMHAALRAITLGLIEVRADGTVWKLSLYRSGRLTPIEPRRAECQLKNGYLGVKVCLDGKQFLVLAHRLVWTVLQGEIPAKLDINHLDGNKHHNHPKNLETATRSRNHLHAYRMSLRKPALDPIVEAHSPAAKALRGSGLKFKAIGAKLGVSQTTAFRAVNF